VIVAVLSLAGPLIIFGIDIVLFSAGIGGFAEIVRSLAGKSSLEQVSPHEYFDVIFPAGMNYLNFELYFLGPASLLIVSLVYSWQVRVRLGWHILFLALPTAVYLSWLSWRRFLITLPVCLFCVIAYVVALRRLHRKRPAQQQQTGTL